MLIAPDAHRVPNHQEILGDVPSRIHSENTLLTLDFQEDDILLCKELSDRPETLPEDLANLRQRRSVDAHPSRLSVWSRLWLERLRGDDQTPREGYLAR